MRNPFQVNGPLDAAMSYVLPVVWAGLLVDVALRGSVGWALVAAALLALSLVYLGRRIRAQRRRAALAARWAQTVGAAGADHPASVTVVEGIQGVDDGGFDRGGR